MPIISSLAPQFSHVRSWVFDLDNTLYTPDAALFDQIDGRIVGFIQRALGVDRDEADRLRHHYWATCGTTLAGLMRDHGTLPDAYLHEVHSIDLAHLQTNPVLADAIAALPGRRIVFTNAPRDYAKRVLAALGLAHVFDAIYAVEDAGFLPKPEAAAFTRVFAADGLDTRASAMFEDDPRNLAAPHAMGMRTVHIAPTAVPAPHIHHHDPHLAAFLSQLV